MAALSDQTQANLIRTQVFSSDITSLLKDELFAMQFVRTLTGFPDGYLINIPILGEAEVQTFNEGQQIRYTSLDTGNFQFSFDQHIYSANSMTEKFKRDSWLSPQVLAAFPERQHRAIMEHYETRVFAVANSGQTASSLNSIFGASHRWVASGTPPAITIPDFAKARYALRRANVRLRNPVMVADPSTTYTLETLANITNLMSPVGSWNSITTQGLSTGFRYRFNVFGFDVYESNYLPAVVNETVNSVSSGANGVANFFFDASPGDTLPWIGAWRQMPTVQSKFDMDLQQWDYLTICEYGVKLFREQNLVTIITSTTAVPA